VEECICIWVLPAAVCTPVEVSQSGPEGYVGYGMPGFQRHSSIQLAGACSTSRGCQAAKHAGILDRGDRPCVCFSTVPLVIYATADAQPQSLAAVRNTSTHPTVRSCKPVL
jgi:hypothetical protein